MIPPIVNADWARGRALFADVRWSLDGPGRELYRAGHLPGAVFVDVDADLAASPSKERGRHPIPDYRRFAEAMSRCGIGDDAIVVAYDDSGGMSAGRLVWLLRRLGHPAALLDGGLNAWKGELEVGEPEVTAATFTAQPWPEGMCVGIDEIGADDVLIDARAAERYRGDTEPVDAQAGHIPGALNAPWFGNLAPDGRFLSPAQLAERYRALGVTGEHRLVCYCGSGVSACHDLIAVEYAGLGVGALYPGSWSAYAASGRPVEKL